MICLFYSMYFKNSTRMRIPITSKPQKINRQNAIVGYKVDAIYIEKMLTFNLKL